MRKLGILCAAATFAAALLTIQAADAQGSGRGGFGGARIGGGGFSGGARLGGGGFAGGPRSGGGAFAAGPRLAGPRFVPGAPRFGGGGFVRGPRVVGPRFVGGPRFVRHRRGYAPFPFVFAPIIAGATYACPLRRVWTPYGWRLTRACPTYTP